MRANPEIADGNQCSRFFFGEEHHVLPSQRGFWALPLNSHRRVAGAGPVTAMIPTIDQQTARQQPRQALHAQRGG
jgi:hypothetical protein